LTNTEGNCAKSGIDRSLIHSKHYSNFAEPGARVSEEDEMGKMALNYAQGNPEGESKADTGSSQVHH